MCLNKCLLLLQARGNTATNPTTATHTRSTPRPHVHLAQQAMQAGFDPFLPCNSHHVARSYVIDPAAVSLFINQHWWKLNVFLLCELARRSWSNRER